MRLGRLVLTHREKYIEKLKKFYLDAKRTEFLVVAYNQKTVDVSRFTSTDSFKLVPYCAGAEGECSATGRQYRVWLSHIKQFPEIEGWVVHDYDLVCRVPDREIFSRIKPDEYAMIGKAFPVRQEGMKDAGVDTFPFAQDHRHWHKLNPPNPVDEEVDALLMRRFPHTFQGIKTILGGYSDFIATSRKNFLLLDDPAVKDFSAGGNEQIPHSIWGAKGIQPVDLRPWYKMKISLDVMYMPMDARYDMIHPVKIWEGESVPPRERAGNVKRKLKNFVKWLIGYQGWKRT
ncbi:hypothetical protein C4571_01415 [Candidatus Parcubacteria bacterium]|nr:MAG: hypothetical protein C4571_01415 [Candidatus Parcubacteria bacterium]